MGEVFGFGREVLFSECGYRARLAGCAERYAGYCLKMRCCRERPMCRSVPGECYLLTTYNAIRKCRDSACWRPFGVRLRGNGGFLRSLLHGCAAPLRMTQWADCCVGGTILFR